MDKLDARIKILTGSLLKKTSDVRVKINHLFFQDVHPIPTHQEYIETNNDTKISASIFFKSKVLALHFSVIPSHNT